MQLHFYVEVLASAELEQEFAAKGLMELLLSKLGTGISPALGTLWNGARLCGVSTGVPFTLG